MILRRKNVTNIAFKLLSKVKIRISTACWSFKILRNGRIYKILKNCTLTKMLLSFSNHQRKLLDIILSFDLSIIMSFQITMFRSLSDTIHHNLFKSVSIIKTLITSFIVLRNKLLFKIFVREKFIQVKHLNAYGN